jgi:tRNA(Ile)-lysidine synthase
MSADNSVERFDSNARAALLECGVTAGDLLVVAVSGGPDSLSLLHALGHLRAGMGLRLHGAHLDHRLRGAASESDARFVADTCRDLGIGLTADSVDVAALGRRKGLSLEEAAREARYEFLARVVAEQGAKAVVLGHTADDQAETVLMNIVRGSGLAGLRGMRLSTTRVIAGTDVLLLRPLLGVSGQETRDYCARMKLEPRQDESNLSTEFTRNRVRLELLPILEQLNPAVRGALARLSRNAAQAEAHLDIEVDTVWRDAVSEAEGGLVLAKDIFLRLDPAVRSHLLRRAVAALKGDLDRVHQGHIEDMARLISGPVGRSLDLPGGLRFSTGYSEATIASARLAPCPLPPLEGEHILSIPGETAVGGWRVTASVLDRGETDASARDLKGVDRRPIGAPTGLDPAGLAVTLSHDSLGERLIVRGRRPGDLFQPLGMQGHKKLQDVLVDDKVPRAWRNRVPLVVTERGIAWIAGSRTADWARVKDTDATVLELRFELISS